MTLTAERLREVLHYNPDTGAFTWRVSSGPIAAGTIAGTETDGYINIQVDGTIVRAHRLAWLYVTGDWPDQEIDHRDLNRANNRWGNLRPATRSQNKQNVGRYRNNTSGHKGVSFNCRLGKWHAQIRSNGVRLHLGYFDDVAIAGEAYADAALRLNNEFARIAA